MTPQRTVVIMTTVSLMIFLAAGGRVETVMAKLRGAAPPAPTKGTFTAGTLVAWAFLFTFLIVMADIPATGQLAAAFAMLIFLSVAITYGTAAFENIAKLATPSPNFETGKQAPPGTGTPPGPTHGFTPNA